MSLVEEPDFYESFDILWDVGKYEDAIRLYEFLKRPFWLANQIGCYFEGIQQLDRAMYEYEHLINAYFDMGPNFLPLPGGPVELYKLGKWFIRTDPFRSEKYLRLYVQADEVNRGEPVKTTYRTEAMQLLEVLMKNKRDFIKQRLGELASCPNVIPLRGPRTMPDALSVALHPQTRVGLWWYQPITGEMFFSVSAGHHLKISEFVGIKDVRGGARGAIFQRDDLNYLLIYKCDLSSEVLSGHVLVDIYEKAQKFSGLEITGGVFDEEGRDLMGDVKEVA
jgi:hypothetical protein